MLFNARSDTIRAQSHLDLDNVMHVFDAHWHGIRSATACLPGHKVAISHKRAPSGDAIHRFFGYIASHGVRDICFQALSENALTLAKLTKQEFGSTVNLYVITHVSSAQFVNHFELLMLKEMKEGLKTGLFRRLGSVKPRFHDVVPEFWPHTLVNTVPRVDLPLLAFREVDAVFLPVENNWRKNLYTNTLGGIHCEAVKAIYVVNWPSHLDNLIDLQKIKVLPFMRPHQVLLQAASCGAILHSSLIECQPMTILEALAVGTPYVSAKLGVHPELEKHAVAQLCEIDYPDDVGAIRERLTRIVSLWKQSAKELGEMISDLVKVQKRLNARTYLEFLA